MKAVIVGFDKGFAAALTDDGCIKKVRNKNYEIGQVIEMKGTLKKAFVLAACAAALVLAFSFGAYAYFDPYSYVSLDVNPSIELTLNRFDRVLTVKAVNDDGLEIVKDIKLRNKKIDKAIEIAVDKLTEAGFFDGEDSGVVISASAGNEKRAEILVDKLQKKIENRLEEREREAVVEAVSVAKERVKEARELGVTPGKLRLVEKLRESAPDPDSIVVEEWVDKPVREIISAMRENKEQREKAGEEDGAADEESRQNAGKNEESRGEEKGRKDGEGGAAGKPNEKAREKEDSPVSESSGKGSKGSDARNSDSGANTGARDESPAEGSRDNEGESRNDKVFTSSKSREDEEKDAGKDRKENDIESGDRNGAGSVSAHNSGVNKGGGNASDRPESNNAEKEKAAPKDENLDKAGTGANNANAARLNAK